MAETRKAGSWESWIDQRIREAQEAGKFDRLPGAGRPLVLESNPYARDQELAFKLLKDAGYAPEWIELDKTIRLRLDSVQAILRHRWERHQARLLELAGRTDTWGEIERERALSAWQRALDEFASEISEINGQIAELNLKVPSPRFQRHKIDALRAVRRLEESESDG